MSVAEQLRLLEALWADLSQCEAALQSPPWHQEVLDQRESRVASEQARFSDWGDSQTGDP